LDPYLKWFQMIVASSFATMLGLVLILRPVEPDTTVLFWLVALALILMTAVLIARQSRKIQVLVEDDPSTNSDGRDAMFRSVPSEPAESIEPNGGSVRLDDLQNQLQSLLGVLRQQRESIHRSVGDRKYPH
jgi:uncharacterized protein (DUF58 family)